MKAFFVGYLPVPKDMKLMLTLTVLTFVGTFALTAWAVGATQDNPGDGRLRFDLGRQTVTGVLETTPYPVLHVTSGSSAVDIGETLMLSGVGKFGVEPHASAIKGGIAEVTGVILNRGTIRMLQVNNPGRNLKMVEGEGDVPEARDLGRWRLAGEVCDGKCLAGAMRPGRGIAHKACAELCIQGGVPPVFVTTQPVEGHEFLMMGSVDGGPLPDALLDVVGVYVSVEGRVEQRGNLAVFLPEPETINVLP